MTFLGAFKKGTFSLDDEKNKIDEDSDINTCTIESNKNINNLY